MFVNLNIESLAIISTVEFYRYGYKYYCDREGQINHLMLHRARLCVFLSRVPRDMTIFKSDPYMSIFVGYDIMNERIANKIRNRETNLKTMLGYYNAQDAFNNIYLLERNLLTCSINTKQQVIVINNITLDTPDLILDEGAIEYAFE